MKTKSLLIAMAAYLGLQGCADNLEVSAQPQSTKSTQDFSEGPLFLDGTNGADSSIVVAAPMYPDKWKCTFHFRGQNGATWISERYRLDDYCDGELSTVRANNPRATILSVEVNFVRDAVASADKNKCRFDFQGRNGARWFSERYIDANLSCDTEMAIVRANNPNATILKVTQNYVHDAVLGAHKNRCEFRLNNGRSSWFVERYTEYSCDSETSTVLANNPNARIVEVRENYVFDPY